MVYGKSSYINSRTKGLSQTKRNFHQQIQIALLTNILIATIVSHLGKLGVQFQTKIYITYFSTPIYTTEQRQRSIVSNTLNAGDSKNRTGGCNRTLPSAVDAPEAPDSSFSSSCSSNGNGPINAPWDHTTKSKIGADHLAGPYQGGERVEEEDGEHGLGHHIQRVSVDTVHVVELRARPPVRPATT